MINKKDIFPIGIGTWGIGGLAERDLTVDKDKQVEALAYMFQKGMNIMEANMWYSEGYALEILAEALEKSGKKREDIFICQAVYLKNGELKDTEVEVDQLLKLFKTDYIDSLQFTQSTFLQYDFDDICQTIGGIIDKGKSRFTSITNENLDLLKRYHQKFGDKLFSHEVAYNFEIRANEEEGTIGYAEENSILNVVYQPLRRNKTAIRNWPMLVELAKKYKATQNQIILAWIVSKGFIPLTKSESIAHIDEHLAALNIKLDQKDIENLNNFVPENYKKPKIDWNRSGEGVRVFQLSDVFEEYCPIEK